MASLQHGPAGNALDLGVVHVRSGAVLVAEGARLVVVIDLGGLDHAGGALVVEALARQREAHPRPAAVVNLTIVGERASTPDTQKIALGRAMGEHMSAFVCVPEGSGTRAKWVRGILGTISAFSPRRNPMFVVGTIEEAAAITARELGVDADDLTTRVTALRARAGAR